MVNHKNVLVLSDNSYLCIEASKIINELIDASYKVKFAVSPKSDIKSFLPIEVEKINLRNQSEVSSIISIYGLIISIHCKQLFPKELVNCVRCVNIHPGYNPINRGWYPQVFSIINDTPIGATIHEIDEELDHGNIIAREFVEKSVADTSLNLYDKISRTELTLFRKHIKSIFENSYKTIKPENEGHLYLKKDFNELCKIELDERTTYKACIDRLRALTHGEYLNAYFIDNVSGEKIYIKLELIKSNV